MPANCEKIFLSPALGLGFGFLAALSAACADRLPDQDLRILNATPAAKISSGLLWKDYSADAKAADTRYWGKAVEMSGRISTVVPDAPARLIFLPDRDAKNGIEARLLDDRAKDTLTGASAGDRITLRCFSEGMQQGNLILKSCVKP